MKKIFSIILLLFCIDNLYAQNDRQKVVDDLENEYLLDEIRVLPNAPNVCNRGFFHIEFTDGAGTGFNAPTIKATELRDVVCQVFEDLSQLIVPANNPYTNASNQNIPLVNIDVNSRPFFFGGAVAFGGSYYVTPNFFGYTNGIRDGEVWKTINGGYDSYTVKGIEVGNSFFHGTVRFNFNTFLPANFHTDLTTASPGGTIVDTYRVTLHEAIHALGFLSALRQIGPIIQPSSLNYFNRFDTFLKYNTNVPVLNNVNSCGNVSINNSALSNYTAGCQNVRFVGNAAGNLPVYAPGTFANNSSLSHFDETCTPFTQYLMQPNVNLNGLIRRPTDDEVRALCDLGYKTTSTFGTNPLYIGTYYTAYPSCGMKL